MSALRLAIVAGEPSGDMLGADLVRSLGDETGVRPELIGVGGERLIAEGLGSLFDYSELSIIGFSAVIAQLPRLIARINQTAEKVIARLAVGNLYVNRNIIHKRWQRNCYVSA